MDYFLGSSQLDWHFQSDCILLHATGDDPNFVVQVSPTPGHRTLFMLDIGSPIETTLEVFYQVGASPFSASHTRRFPLRIGRNKAVFEFNDPQFTGAFRVDPGERAADYSLYSMAVFSIDPVSFVRQTKSQEELARSFSRAQPGPKRSENVVWRMKSPAEQLDVQGLNDVVLKPGSRGLEINATGRDPSLLLPALTFKTGAVAKIVITSPAPTTLQVFFKSADQIEYDQANSFTQPIKAGENIVYFDHTGPARGSRLRLDPGTEPGRYLLKEIELRATGTNSQDYGDREPDRQ